MAITKHAAVSLEDKAPPQNHEAEMAALGSMLLGERGVDAVLSQLNQDDFYSPAHQEIYAACYAIVASGRAVDLITLRNELSQRGTLDRVGGVDYLIQVAESVATPSHASHYAGIVLDMATLCHTLLQKR